MGTDQTVTRRLGQVEYGHEDGESSWRWRVQVDIVIFKGRHGLSVAYYWS
jgi:hypothetical protein